MKKQIAGLVIAVAIGGAASCPVVYAQGLNPAAKSALQKPVTVNFQETDIQAAIRTLLQNTGVQYSVDSDVRGTVTIALTNQPLQDALKQVLAAGGYAYQIDPNSGMLKIGAKLTPPPVAPPAPDDTIPTPVVPADEATRDNRTWQFIPVNNTLPEFVMMQLMSPAGQIMGYHDPSQLPEEAMYSRGGGGMGGGMMGGMGGGMGGGMMGGMGGGMGGMGGGMMGGMGGMGGGMMGGMGGMGGGMMGGMGGMGGGMMGGMGGMGGGMMGGGMGGMGGGMGRRY